ncbi:MAG TPA: PhoH family protein, partial [Burkholderiaceae bacterium]
MPLPKPPATRAALLSAADYESQSAPKPSRRSQKVADPKARLLDLHDDRAETAVARPAAKAATAVV